MISKGTGYYALRYSLSGLVIQFVCSGYPVCLGRKYNQTGAVVQFAWGVSTIKLGWLYSLSVLAVQVGCIITVDLVNISSAFFVQAVGAIIYIVIPSNTAKRDMGCLEKLFILKRLEAI